MGFSHGASAAMYSGLVRFQKLHGNPDVRYAAHVSLYGLCVTAFNEDEMLDQSPVLMLHGTADDWMPIAPCREYAARLGKAGMNARFIEYPGAYHVFDSPDRREQVKLPQASTVRNCRFVEAEGGSLINVVTRQPASADAPCIEKGVTIQYNEAAAKKAHDDVLDFLRDTFARK
jgi:dienelactone hydrolase